MYLVRGGSRGTGDAAPPDSDDGHPAGGPSAGLLLTEPIRGLADLAALLLAAPGLAAAPRGDGHGVLVFPGLLAGDTSTVPLRAFLRWLGYDVRGWDLGRNHGPTEAVLPACPGLSLIMRADRPPRIAGGLEPRRHLRQGDRAPAPAAGPAGDHPRQSLALHDPRQNHAQGPYQRLSYLHARAGLPPPAARPAHQRAFDVGVLPLGRGRALAGVHRAGDRVARECRGPLQSSRVRRGPGDAVADRRPAGRPGRPECPFRPPLALRPLYPGRR